MFTNLLFGIYIASALIVVAFQIVAIINECKGKDSPIEKHFAIFMIACVIMIVIQVISFIFAYGL